MPILFHAVIAPLLCIIHAVPLGQESGLINTTEVTGFFSPRVTLSTREPPLLIDSSNSHQEQLMCNSISMWVTDKQTAVNIAGKNVAVLSTVQTPTGRFKQYFFETKCHPAEATKGGCLGVDHRYWISECKTKESYVRALAQNSDGRVGWHWISINTSCVCSLFVTTGQK